MISSIKPVLAGIGGVGVTWMEWLPIAIRVAVGIATFTYICIKIYKEIKR